MCDYDGFSKNNLSCPGVSNDYLLVGNNGHPHFQISFFEKTIIIIIPKQLNTKREELQ